MPGANLPKVPDGLRDMMKNLTKEVLREKPPNIYEFSAQYFETILQDGRDSPVRGHEPIESYETILNNRVRHQVPLSLVYSLIPDSLTELIKEFIKSVLRESPSNIYAFAVEYFRKLQIAKDLQTKPVEYSAYEKYFQKKDRYTYTPFVKCSCGRTLGNSSNDSMYFNQSPNKSKSKFTKKRQASRQESKEGKVNEVASLSEANHKCKTSAKEKENSKNKKNDYSGIQYMNAIYVIQRQFRIYLTKKRNANEIKEKVASILSQAKATDKGVDMSIESAAFIIQKTFRRFVRNRLSRLRSSNSAQLSKIESQSQGGGVDDNVSEAASYTSASTALLSTESAGEHFEFGNNNYEEGVLQQTIKEDEEVENDNQNEKKLNNFHENFGTDANNKVKIIEKSIFSHEKDEVTSKFIQKNTKHMSQDQNEINENENDNNESNIINEFKNADNIVASNSSEATNLNINVEPLLTATKVSNQEIGTHNSNSVLNNNGSNIPEKSNIKKTNNQNEISLDKDLIVGAADNNSEEQNNKYISDINRNSVLDKNITSQAETPEMEKYPSSKAEEQFDNLKVEEKISTEEKYLTKDKSMLQETSEEYLYLIKDENIIESETKSLYANPECTAVLISSNENGEVLEEVVPNKNTNSIKEGTENDSIEKTEILTLNEEKNIIINNDSTSQEEVDVVESTKQQTDVNIPENNDNQKVESQINEEQNVKVSNSDYSTELSSLQVVLMKTKNGSEQEEQTDELDTQKGNQVEPYDNSLNNVSEEVDGNIGLEKTEAVTKSVVATNESDNYKLDRDSIAVSASEQSVNEEIHAEIKSETDSSNILASDEDSNLATDTHLNDGQEELSSDKDNDWVCPEVNMEGNKSKGSEEVNETVSLNELLKTIEIKSVVEGERDYLLLPEDDKKEDVKKSDTEIKNNLIKTELDLEETENNVGTEKASIKEKLIHESQMELNDDMENKNQNQKDLDNVSQKLENCAKVFSLESKQFSNLKEGQESLNKKLSIESEMIEETNKKPTKSFDANDTENISETYEIHANKEQEKLNKIHPHDSDAIEKIIEESTETVETIETTDLKNDLENYMENISHERDATKSTAELQKDLEKRMKNISHERDSTKTISDLNEKQENLNTPPEQTKSINEIYADNISETYELHELDKEQENLNKTLPDVSDATENILEESTETTADLQKDLENNMENISHDRDATKIISDLNEIQENLNTTIFKVLDAAENIPQDNSSKNISDTTERIEKLKENQENYIENLSSEPEASKNISELYENEEGSITTLPDVLDEIENISQRTSVESEIKVEISKPETGNNTNVSELNEKNEKVSRLSVTAELNDDQEVAAVLNVSENNSHIENIENYNENLSVKSDTIEEINNQKSYEISSDLNEKTSENLTTESNLNSENDIEQNCAKVVEDIIELSTKSDIETINLESVSIDNTSENNSMSMTASISENIEENNTQSGLKSKIEDSSFLQIKNAEKNIAKAALITKNEELKENEKTSKNDIDETLAPINKLQETGGEYKNIKVNAENTKSIDDEIVDKNLRQNVEVKLESITDETVIKSELENSTKNSENLSLESLEDGKRLDETKDLIKSQCSEEHKPTLENTKENSGEVEIENAKIIKETQKSESTDKQQSDQFDETAIKNEEKSMGSVDDKMPLQPNRKGKSSDDTSNEDNTTTRIHEIIPIGTQNLLENSTVQLSNNSKIYSKKEHNSKDRNKKLTHSQSSGRLNIGPIAELQLKSFKTPEDAEPWYEAHIEPQENVNKRNQNTTLEASVKKESDANVDPLTEDLMQNQKIDLIEIRKIIDLALQTQTQNEKSSLEGNTKSELFEEKTNKLDEDLANVFTSESLNNFTDKNERAPTYLYGVPNQSNINEKPKSSISFFVPLEKDDIEKLRFKRDLNHDEIYNIETNEKISGKDLNLDLIPKEIETKSDIVESNEEFCESPNISLDITYAADEINSMKSLLQTIPEQNESELQTPQIQEIISDQTVSLEQMNKLAQNIESILTEKVKNETFNCSKSNKLVESQIKCLGNSNSAESQETLDAEQTVVKSNNINSNEIKLLDIEKTDNNLLEQKFLDDKKPDMVENLNQCEIKAVSSKVNKNNHGEINSKMSEADRKNNLAECNKGAKENNELLSASNDRVNTVSYNELEEVGDGTENSIESTEDVKASEEFDKDLFDQNNGELKKSRKIENQHSSVSSEEIISNVLCNDANNNVEVSKNDDNESGVGAQVMFTNPENREINTKNSSNLIEEQGIVEENETNNQENISNSLIDENDFVEVQNSENQENNKNSSGLLEEIDFVAEKHQNITKNSPNLIEETDFVVEKNTENQEIAKNSSNLIEENDFVAEKNNESQENTKIYPNLLEEQDFVGRENTENKEKPIEEQLIELIRSAPSPPSNNPSTDDSENISTNLSNLDSRNNAAKVIQRLFKNYLRQKQGSKVRTDTKDGENMAKNEAARIIQKAFRRFTKYVSQRKQQKFNFKSEENNDDSILNHKSIESNKENVELNVEYRNVLNIAAAKIQGAYRKYRTQNSEWQLNKPFKVSKITLDQVQDPAAIIIQKAFREYIKKKRYSENLSTSHSAYKHIPTPIRNDINQVDDSHSQAEILAAVIIQKAFRSYIRGKSSDENFDNSSIDNSFDSSQITEIYKPILSEQRTSLDTIVNANSSENLTTYEALAQPSKCKESNEFVAEKKKSEWFVGNEPIVTSKASQNIETNRGTLNFDERSTSSSNEIDDSITQLVNACANVNDMNDEISTLNSSSLSIGNISNFNVEDEKKLGGILETNKNDKINSAGSDNEDKKGETQKEVEKTLEKDEEKMKDDSKNCDTQPVIEFGEEFFALSGVTNMNDLMIDFITKERQFSMQHGKSVGDITEIPYEFMEEPCIKKSMSTTNLTDVKSSIDATKLEAQVTTPNEDLSANAQDESVLSESTTQSELGNDNSDFDTSVAETLESASQKMAMADEVIDRMSQRRASEVQTTPQLSEKLIKEPSFEEPVIRPMSALHEQSSVELDDGYIVVLNELQREDTRESSAQSDSIVFGKNELELAEPFVLKDADLSKTPLKRMYTIAGDDPKSIFKSVTIDETIKYIDPPTDTMSGNGGSFCLDEDISENIRKKMMAYSLSEADSDFFEACNDGKDTSMDRSAVRNDDFNISTALADTTGTSTETESTIVSAATKIQAGARGFLTRRRMRRTSGGTKSSTQETKASFGNEAIGESLERQIEDEAAKKIQCAYRKHYYQNRKNNNEDTEEGISQENSLAARRLTLQRGDAMRNDSTPDEDNSGNGNENTSSETNENSVLSQSSSGVMQKKPRGKYTLKCLTTRQNSLPVQIDSELFRVIPKHMRKRVQSAESEKKTRHSFSKN